MPEITMPQVEIPSIPQPVVNVTAGEMPNISIPLTQTVLPDIPQPAVNVAASPAMAMPDIPQPVVNVAASKMPEITMPQVEIPRIPQPVVNVTDSEMPNISIPQPMVNVMASQPEIAQAVPAITVDEPVQPIEAPHSYDNSHTDFTFAPQITINGNADAGTVGQLKAALEKAERELEAKFDRLMRERDARMRRLSYS